MYIIILLMVGVHGTVGQFESIDMKETGSYFQEHYTKAIILRFSDGKIKVPVTTTAKTFTTAALKTLVTEITTAEKTTPGETTAGATTDRTKQTTTTKAFNLEKSNGIMKDAWDRYEKAVKIGELERVGRNGTTDAMVEMAAREIWERTGGKLVIKVTEVVGPKVGASFGRYLGGAIGIACGIFFPPLQVPLVIGGVFIGGNLGRIIGFVGGKIAANVVNSMIADKIIFPHLQKELEEVLRKWMNNSAHSADVTCRSDICGKGDAENKCKCEECWKDSDYSDRAGLSTCKRCTPGSKPYKCNRWSAANCGCQACGEGYHGADGSTCKLCRKEMEHSDSKGLKTCKKCKVGTFPYECSHNYGHCGCRGCPAGKVGTNKGQCVECSGVMQYSDSEGSAKCKDCILGSTPYECRHNYGHCGCRKCPEGKIGTSEGQCVECSAVMQYSDSEGSAKCKDCILGSTPYECRHNYGHCGCRKCPKGMFGTYEGQCVECSGVMQYSDSEGSAKCKDCILGSTPYECEKNYGHCGCRKCPKGMFGTNKGQCVECSGVMQYSDSEGSAKCKDCTLGSTPYQCEKNYGHCGCRKCPKGRFGTAEGQCHECKGASEYNDVEGASDCKTCNRGSYTVECSDNCGHCDCKKCPMGKYGTDDRACRLCDGRMEYSDSEGSKSCKDCKVGSIPYECRNNNGHCGCTKCSAGKYGTEKGSCVLCNGNMDYSDAEGSISCKKCNLGSIPYECRDNYGHCGCNECRAGSFGTKEGICESCGGDMEYSDTEGSTSCKKCQLGSVPVECAHNNGNCRCDKCPVGSYGTSNGFCLFCQGAEYSDEKGAVSCKTCPSGTISYRCKYHLGNCGCRKN